MMNKNDYVGRRRKLAKDIGSGIVLIFGNKLIPRNYSANTYPFRQDSNFLYFTGISIPGYCLMLDCNKGEEILFGYDPGIEDSIWSGPQASLKEAGQICGIDKTMPDSSLASFIAEAAKEKVEIHYLPPYPHERQLFLSQSLGGTIHEIVSGASITLTKSVIQQREIKSDIEIAEIENALNEVTGPMHIAAMKMAQPGVFEYEVLAEMQKIAARNQVELAYGTICTVRGETLHNIVYSNELKKNQLLLVDAGAESRNHYASDITRTTPVGGKFSSQQREIYSLVLDAQMQIINDIKPGISYLELHLKAARIMADGLTQLGLMKGSSENAVASGAHALFFPHGLGHMLGIDVHDMEDLGENYVGYNEPSERSDQFGTAYLRLGRELKAGFVLTVEPGIYFIPPLIKQWHQAGKFKEFINYSRLENYMNFGGIRIEDNILVTNNGQRVLGNPIPKLPDELENLLAYQ